MFSSTVEFFSFSRERIGNTNTYFSNLLEKTVPSLSHSETTAHEGGIQLNTWQRQVVL